MNRNLILIGIMMAMLLTSNLTRASAFEIVNGSFEDDGPIDDITKQDPNGWTANVPSGKFTAKTDASWSTDGNFSLNIVSRWYTAFAAGDMATVSQQIALNDVNEIRFDVRLNTYAGSTWDPNEITAIVMIDDQIVWEPNNTATDIRGTHLNQVYAVEGKYRDDNLHILSIGLKVNVDMPGGFPEFYRSWWDSIECTFLCGGGGLLAGYFNRDCSVDIKDLELAADHWLAVVPFDDPYNLFKDDDLDPYGVVDFFDFSILADNWQLSSYLEEQQ
ncbi:MAG: hypothetical protein A2173_02125 [Planctomycetes bacterium RBG_13_44_8b]|nr:MAG: hypothetical protein A2173_02125 [Planctomycetes bacterium RBG_13_44_8b]